MRIQTYHGLTMSGMVSLSNFVDKYQDNIQTPVIPPSQLPIYVTNYYIISTGGTASIQVDYSTMELQPTNIYSKRIWNIHFHGILKKDTMTEELNIIFYPVDTEYDEIESLYTIGFEGRMSGTFLVRSSDKVYDISDYWTYIYNSSSTTLTLTFQNSISDAIDLTLDRVFDIYFNIPNIVLTSCQSGSVVFPPDNIKNIYCVHNSSPIGGFGGFAVSGDVVYRDYGQNYRIVPSFLGSRNKLLLTLTKADMTLPENVGAYFGPIFAITYVGGPFGENSYITFENKTSSTVCVWVDPTVPGDKQTTYKSTHTFVDSNRNTVALIQPFTEYFIHFDGQYSPCFP